MSKKKPEITPKDSEVDKDARHMQEFSLMLDRMVKRGVII